MFTCSVIIVCPFQGQWLRKRIFLFSLLGGRTYVCQFGRFLPAHVNYSSVSTQFLSRYIVYIQRDSQCISREYVERKVYTKRDLREYIQRVCLLCLYIESPRLYICYLFSLYKPVDTIILAFQLGGLQPIKNERLEHPCNHYNATTCNTLLKVGTWPFLPDYGTNDV